MTDACFQATNDPVRVHRPIRNARLRTAKARTLRCEPPSQPICKKGLSVPKSFTEPGEPPQPQLTFTSDVQLDCSQNALRFDSKGLHPRTLARKVLLFAAGPRGRVHCTLRKPEQAQNAFQAAQRCLQSLTSQSPRYCGPARQTPALSVHPGKTQLESQNKTPDKRQKSRPSGQTPEKSITHPIAQTHSSAPQRKDNRFDAKLLS